MREKIQKVKEKVQDRLRPAFNEVFVYPFALFGVFCAPFIAERSAGVRPHFSIHIWPFIVALIITVGMVVWSELRGTKEQKKKGNIRLSRYALAFLLGLFWRLVIPLIRDGIVNVVKSAFGG